MRKLILVLLFLLVGLAFLVPTPAVAACNEGEWSFEMETKGESWLGDYGACSGGRYRCHSVCWDRWSTQCVGGVWVRKWVASSGCSKDHVCRAQTGWSGRHCDCCTPPSHNVCQDKACVKVFTSGTNECGTPADPSPDCTHKECNTVTKKCETVPGAGTNKCQNDSECAPPPTPKHKECNTATKKCESVDGAGTDKCTTEADCALPTCGCYKRYFDCCTGVCPETQKQVEWYCPPNKLTCDPPAGFSHCEEANCVCPSTVAWFQTARGDVASNGGLRIDIPLNALAFSSDFENEFYKGPYFSVGDPPGAIFDGTNSVTPFGAGEPSRQKWFAREYAYSSVLLTYDYNFFVANWQPEQTVSGGSLASGVISGWTIPVGGVVVKVEGDLTVENDLNLAGKEAMILVSGTLTFVRDFRPADAGIFFVSQGAVTFKPEVNKVRATVVTSGKVTVEPVVPLSDTGILLEGIYVANGPGSGFQMARSRQNNQAPAAMFDYQPEMIIRLTPLGKARVTSWREVIGGKK